MSDHETCFEDLPLYAIGDLDPARSRAVEAHLTGCSSCAAELAALRATLEPLQVAAARADEPIDLVPWSRGVASARQAGAWPWLLRVAALLLAFAGGVAADRALAPPRELAAEHAWAPPREADPEPATAPPAPEHSPPLARARRAASGPTGFARGLLALSALSEDE